MLSVLVESNPAPRARRGVAIVSMALHGGLIALGAWATGAVKTAAAVTGPEEAVPTVYSPPPAEKSSSPRTGQSTTTGPNLPLPGTAPVDIGPIKVDVGIPSIDERLGELFRVRVTDATTHWGTRSGPRAGPSGAGIVDNLMADKPALPLEENVPPSYPELLRAAAIEGTVEVEFIIEPTGRVRDGSVVALRVDHPQFLAAVTAALSTYRYLPAEVGGRPVAVRVRQRFAFVLNGAG